MLRLGLDVSPAAFEELEEWLRPAVLDPHNALTEAMVEAAIQAGFPYNPSFDSGTLDGAGWNKSTIANSERFNAYRAFVAPVLDRPNLHLQTDTRVLRLAMDGNRALGVAVQRDDGALETISAGEVISPELSPRLLLLSGIGPVSQLERLGIAPVADLPVGENLIDHLLIGVVYDCCSRSPTATPTPPRDARSLARRRTAPTVTSRSRLPRSHTSRQRRMTACRASPSFRGSLAPRAAVRSA